MPRLEANLALRTWTERSERVLVDCMPSEADPPFRLHSAMRYAALGATSGCGPACFTPPAPRSAQRRTSSMPPPPRSS